MNTIATTNTTIRAYAMASSEYYDRWTAVTADRRRTSVPLRMYSCQWPPHGKSPPYSGASRWPGSLVTPGYNRETRRMADANDR